MIAERHGAVAELAEEGLPNTKIAAVLGVDESTVRADKTSGNPEPLTLETALEAEAAATSSGNPEPLDAIAALAADGQLCNAVTQFGSWHRVLVAADVGAERMRALGRVEGALAARSRSTAIYTTSKKVVA